MPALDTNVLVRYVVQDDTLQFAAAKRLVGQCLADGRSIFVPVTVALELEWVLRASYGYVKDDVLQVLSNLLSAEELTFESERALEVALQLYREGAGQTSLMACTSHWQPRLASNRCGRSTKAPPRSSAPSCFAVVSRTGGGSLLMEATV